MCLALTLILGIKGEQDFRAQGCFIASAGHTSSEVPRTRLCQSDFFRKRSVLSHVLRYFSTAQAFAEVTGATLSGRITDSSGAVISVFSPRGENVHKMVKFSRSQQTRALARVAEMPNLQNSCELGMRHARYKPCELLRKRNV